ncbi:hypothetical protein [Thalassospira profundimaris]|uniref:hypothetical protein n=1 Tax=Thalassospira profundimaris TaxID=502049 RepID=UPI00030C7F42|nr:hypothetical protein [Thalassospira profundimaris]
MPRLSGMNPILLKTLIQLAASNKKPAPSGTVGSDAQLKNRIVLFADEAVALPDWGISGLPSMILGAAPQTCLFVSDLTVDDDGEDKDDTGSSDGNSDDASDAAASGSVSFSLTIKAPPAADSSLKSRTIVWKLTLPVAGFRDVQTGASTPPVHAPVIKTRIKLGGVIRDVEIGLLEMGPLDQPLLIGKDTLSNKFLIRPDRPEDQKTPAAPTVDLTPAPAETPKPDGNQPDPTSEKVQPVSPPDTDPKATSGDQTDDKDNASSPSDSGAGTKPPATDTTDTKATNDTKTDPDNKAPDETAKAAPTETTTPDAPPASDTSSAAQVNDQPQDQEQSKSEAGDTAAAPVPRPSSDGTQASDATQTTASPESQAASTDATSAETTDKSENATQSDTTQAEPASSQSDSDEDKTPTQPADTPSTTDTAHPAAPEKEQS